MRLLLASAVLFAAMVSAPSAAAEERCSAIVGQDGVLSYEMLPDYFVLGVAPPYAPPVTAQGPLRGITCLRDTLTLVLDDYRVITDLGVPFMVSAYYEKDEDRILLLQIADGTVAAHIIDGRLTPGERSDLERVVAEMQAAVDAASAQ